MDRPNIYLGRLTDINVRLFIIGKYTSEIKPPYRRVSNITPDIQPHAVLSQTKLENFSTLNSIAQDYSVPFIHHEMNCPPQKLSPKVIKGLKGARANVNIFTDPYLMKYWEFEEGEAIVIENSAESYEMPYKPYHISNILPLTYMNNGIFPVVLKTPYTNSIITNGLNGFLYSNEGELSMIINKLSKMDKDDLSTIGENARKLVKQRFPKEPFLESWKKLLRSII